jgi:hypothetical protein
MNGVYSKLTLKAVFLNNEKKKYQYTMVAHAIHLKECYENMQTLLESTGYDKYSWSMCGDRTVTARLLEMKIGYTHIACEWNSRER